MKRIISIACAAALLMSLCACRKTLKDSEYSSGYTAVFSSSDTDLSSAEGPSTSVSSSTAVSSDTTHAPTASSIPQTGTPSNTTTSSLTVPSVPSGSVPNLPIQMPDDFKLSRSRECYKKLTAEQKRIYDIIDVAVDEMREGLIPLGNCTLQDMAIAVYAVRTDRPEYFWMPSSYISEIKSTGERNIAFSFTGNDGHTVSYLCTAQERTAMEKKLREAAFRIISAVPAGVSDYETELIIHDLLCQNTVYKHNGKTAFSTTSYGALAEGSAVCEGYARAMQLLLDQFSIPCTLVYGTANNTPHMWNLVKISGQWYHLDATWNDSEISGGYTMHGYFNMNDEYITRTHLLDSDVSLADDDMLLSGSFNLSLPACTSLDYFYCKREGRILTDAAKQSMETIVQKLKEDASARKSGCEFYVESNETNFEVKYSLQKCINDVKSSGINFSVTSFATSGKSLVLKIQYEGE